MIKSFTAITREVDDPETAAAEIMSQLDLGGKNKLLGNTVGIVTCFSEYIETGVFAALCDKLPFEVLGTTTISSMAAGTIGETMLCLMVLTSDVLSFSTNLSAPVSCEDEDVIRALYRGAAEKLPGKPSLMLSFAPLLNNFSSDYYIDTMTEVSGNVPNFGALAVDHNPDYHDSQVMMNGESWKDRFAVLLICGEIMPSFFIGTISDKRIFPGKGVVTASEGNRLQTVDGRPVTDYLQSIGLRKSDDGSVAGINAFPVILDYNDSSTPVIRAMFAITPEGYAVCGGNVPVGVTLSVGTFDKEDIVETTNRTLGRVLETKIFSALLMYACIGRYFALGYEPNAEFQALLPMLRESGTGYMAAYAGGELCPVYDSGGVPHNRNHNNTFIVCAF